jgi:hypothetical protein
MNTSNTGGGGAAYRSPEIKKQRAFLAFPRAADLLPREKRSQKEITENLCRLANACLPQGEPPVTEMQLSAVPRIIQGEGECNWQVLVFLPVPSEVLAAIGSAGSELQAQYDMADFFQGARALIV